jgi:choline transport protein
MSPRNTNHDGVSGTSQEPSACDSRRRHVPCINNINDDDAELEASGYTREMPRRFSIFSLFALAYALICTWNGFASAIGNGLRQGSSAGSIFLLFPAAAMIGIVSLGMAELTSAFPVAGGQYYWAFILAPPEWAPFLSYL